MSKDKNDTVDSRGKVKGFADVFYSSPTWKRCARGYRASVNGLCEDCLKRGMIVPAEEVHHKIKLTPANINRPEVALNWANLIALCKQCHIKKHRKQKRWKVDEEGAVTLRDPPL